MSGSSWPNILKRKRINTFIKTEIIPRDQEDVREGPDPADSKNVLEKSHFYKKLVNAICTEDLNCNRYEVAKVKRRRENSSTSQMFNIYLDDVVKVDGDARLAFTKPSILRRPQPAFTSKETSQNKPSFSEVEFLDESVWNIATENEVHEPPIEETNYPRSVHDNFEWNIIKEINSKQTRKEPFTGTPGPVTDFMSPYDAFTAIWNQNLLEEIIKTTNKNGEELANAKRELDILKKRRAIEPSWKDITISEMYVYLAIVISTALCKKKSYYASFVNIDDINYTPLYSKHMSADRFRKISQALIFINKKTKDTELDYYEEKLLGIKPLVNLLNESFSSLYRLHQNIVIEKIRSVHTTHFRKFERVIGLFDSSTGYCWQLNIILDEVPKYTSLLKRYVESQCINDDIGVNGCNIAESDSAYVKSTNKRSKKMKLSKKETKNSTENEPHEIKTKEMHNESNKSHPDNKTSSTCDLLTSYNKNDPNRSKTKSTDNSNKTNPINKDDVLETNASIIALNLNKEEISTCVKTQDEIPYDEDLPPLSRPVPATVLDFVKNLHFKGHTLFMDWSFQTLPLARTLKSLGIDCVGSFHCKSPHAPDELKQYINGKRELIPGQVLGYTTDDVDIILWNERKVLTLLSTYHGLATIGETNLLAAVDYNFNMSVLDRFRKNLKSLCFQPFCSQELTARIYVPYLFSISLINAFILHQSSTGCKEMNLKQFVDDLVENLLNRHGVFSTKRIVVNVSPNPRDHLPVPCKTRIICLLCDHRRRLATYHCVSCNKYLCFNCFHKYHETIASALEVSQS